MAGLSGRRTMVAVRPPFCPKLPNLGSTGWDFVPMESPSPGLKSQPLSMPTRLWPKEATTPRQSGPSSASAVPAKIVLDIETPLFWTNNSTTNLPPTGSVVADGAVGHG